MFLCNSWQLWTGSERSLYFREFLCSVNTVRSLIWISTVSRWVYKIWESILYIELQDIIMYPLYLSCDTPVNSPFSLSTHSYKSCVSISTECNCLNCASPLKQSVELQFGMQLAKECIRSAFVCLCKNDRIYVLKLFLVIPPAHFAPGQAHVRTDEYRMLWTAICNTLQLLGRSQTRNKCPSFVKSPVQLTAVVWVGPRDVRSVLSLYDML